MIMRLHLQRTRLSLVLLAASFGPACESAPKAPFDTPAPIAKETSASADEGASASSGNVGEATEDVAEVATVEPPKLFLPQPAFTAGDDWIQLVSGEWLRGELSSLSRESIVFDSEELDELTIDWEDVTEVVTDQPFTLVLADRETIVGVPHVKGKSFTVTTAEGQRELARDDVLGFIHGKPTAANYWSGHARLSGTVRTGNTEQLDTALSLLAVRRTASSRLSTDLTSVFSQVEGTETANNQTLTGSLDFYVTRRLYVRPIGLDMLSDRIQNIDLRFAPYTGFGYMLVDESDMEWEVTSGLGYRSTKFESVSAGESNSDDTMTGVFSTDYSWEVTNHIDLLFGYGFQASLEDVNDTNHDASFGLTFEFPWELDFNFGAVWRRVGQPEADENGVFPANDDLRLEIGVQWEF